MACQIATVAVTFTVHSSIA